MERQTTGEGRVRMTARQLSEPRTTNWIASEANWSHEPTKRVLERLVDDGILHRDGSGTHTTYYPDYRRKAMQEAMRLRDSGHTVEELTDRLTDMKTQIRNWEDEYDVDRDPTFGDLDKRVFREYARHLAGDRGLKQNSRFCSRSGPFGVWPTELKFPKYEHSEAVGVDIFDDHPRLYIRPS